MAEVSYADRTGPFPPIESPLVPDPSFLPVWARSSVKYAKDLLESSDKPFEIEYDDDEDYREHSFFFPEDCVYYPPLKALSSNPDATAFDSDDESTDDMAPMLPNIKMLDTVALTDLLSDNLSPPEITSILIFATNGAIFAHASPLSQRRLRNLAAVYGAAYTSYAVTSSRGNLTGVNPTSHPTSFVTAPSIPLGDVGSIIFELEDQKLVAVVTKIADRVLLAVVGPTRIDQSAPTTRGRHITGSAASDRERTTTTAPDSLSSTFNQSDVDQSATKLASSAPNPGSLASSAQRVMSAAGSPDQSLSAPQNDADETLRTQWEIDRKSDLDRLASLNLSSSPTILLALESKSAALGRFLGNKLADLENPEDF